MKIIWIRHAESLVNSEYRTYLNQPDPALSSKGKEQALALVLELKDVEHVIVSKLKRAQQTAALAFPTLPTTISSTCREWIFGPPEMTETEYKQQLIDTKEAYWHAETAQELQKRCSVFYLELVQFAASHPTVTCLAIVSHASFIRDAMVSHGWGFPGGISATRGKVVGGCSAINGCGILAAMHEDYDEWSQIVRGSDGCTCRF